MSVKVYTKDNCMQCNFAKKLLNTLGVGFEEVYVDVSKDIETINTLKSMGMASFPVILFNEDWSNAIAGFSPNKIKEAVKNGY